MSTTPLGAERGTGEDTLPHLLRAAAARHGDRIAYVHADEELTYAALLDRVRAVAAGYVALGLEPGGRVVVWGPNSIAWVVHALAATYAGGTLVPANSRYTAAEVCDLVARSQARIVVVDDGFLGRTQIADLAAAGLTAPALLDLHGAHDGTVADALSPQRLTELAADVDADSVERRADAVRPDDVADILFTSGTTGRSKGALSAHRQTIGVARAWAALGEIDRDDRYLVINPFFHSFGYKIGIVVGLITGARLYPMATFDVEESMGLIEREQITVLPGAPTIYQSILAAPTRPDHDLSSLRLAVTGAAVVPVVLIEQMRHDLQIAHVVTAFGMTEAVVVTMCRSDDPADIVATTCGRPIDGMEIALGEQDELLVRGDYVMLGYLDDEAATAEAIDADGWLHTGDIARIDEHGNLQITDRLKDMYISGGFNVYPAEVEQSLLQIPGVVDAAVIGIPDERLGEVGAAYLVAGDGKHLTPDEVIAQARERLANFKVPRRVEFVDVLPRNLSGKVQKRDLRGEHRGS